MTADLLTLQEAADALGCHYMTLYRRVRSGEVAARMAGGRYRIERAELDTWLDRRPATEGAVGRDVRERDWAAHADVVHDGLLAGREADVRQAVERLVGNGADPVDVCERVVAPALTRVGEGWHRGEVLVAQEHRASAIATAVLGTIGPTFSRPGPRRGTVVVATPPGNLHGLAPAMVAAALRADRFRVHLVGADVPVEDLVAFARGVEADLVTLSVAIAAQAGAPLRRTVAALREAGVPTVVGGRGVDAGAARAAGADGHGESLREAQALARDVVGAAD